MNTTAEQIESARDAIQSERARIAASNATAQTLTVLGAWLTNLVSSVEACSLIGLQPVLTHYCQTGHGHYESWKEEMSTEILGLLCDQLETEGPPELMDAARRQVEMQKAASSPSTS